MRRQMRQPEFVEVTWEEFEAFVVFDKARHNIKAEIDDNLRRRWRIALGDRPRIERGEYARWKAGDMRTLSEFMREQRADRMGR